LKKENFSVFILKDKKWKTIKNRLTEKEKKELNSKIASKKRTWLAGRIAIKIVIRNYFFKRFKLKIPFYEIEIKSGNGKPTCDFLGNTKEYFKDKRNIFFDLSISHSGFFGAGAISEIKKDGWVGIDIEKERHFKKEFIKAFLTDKEYENLKKFSYKKRDRVTTLVWCIKEAYLKAIGSGIKIHPREIEIELINHSKKYIISKNNKEIKSKNFWKFLDENMIIVKVNLLKNNKIWKNQIE